MILVQATLPLRPINGQILVLAALSPNALQGNVDVAAYFDRYYEDPLCARHAYWRLQLITWPFSWIVLSHAGHIPRRFRPETIQEMK